MIQLSPITFKLKKPFMSFGKVLSHKESVLLNFFKADQLIMSSELSLYPGLTPELTEAHRSILQNDLDELLNSTTDKREDLETLTQKLPQAFRLCAETLWLKKHFQKEFEGPRKLKTSGLITDLKNPPELFPDTIKIKMARAPLANELPLLIKLLEKTHFRFRLDPNEAWTMSDLIHCHSALTSDLKERLDYVESPLPFSTQKELDDLIQASPFPLAFDLTPDRVHFDFSKAHALVLKPALLSFKETQSIMQAYEQKTRLVLSSLFEGPQGLADLLCLTAFLPISLQSEVHGLGTLNHLEHPLELPFEIPVKTGPHNSKIEQQINELVLIPSAAHKS